MQQAGQSGDERRDERHVVLCERDEVPVAIEEAGRVLGLPHRVDPRKKGRPIFSIKAALANSLPQIHEDLLISRASRRLRYLLAYADLGVVKMIA